MEEMNTTCQNCGTTVFLKLGKNFRKIKCCKATYCSKKKRTKFFTYVTCINALCMFLPHALIFQFPEF
jgi:hypothetical protein